MNNYYKKDSVISYAKSQSFYITSIDLGITPKGKLVWYGRGFISNNHKEKFFIIPQIEKLEYVSQIPQNIRPIKIDEVLIIDGYWCQYIHRAPKKYQRNVRGCDMILSKQELLEKQLVDMLPYTNKSYRCYAVMEDGICVNFLWAAGNPNNFAHMVFALDTVKEYTPSKHTLIPLVAGNYIKCPKAKNGLFCYDHNGLFRVDMSLLAKVRNSKQIVWM